jgi:3-oxoacid CoA-transferase subunit A
MKVCVPHDPNGASITNRSPRCDQPRWRVRLVLIAEGKELKEFNGETYVLERGIFADLAIVKAWKADATGNLVFRKTARNFNPPAAMCGKVCVVEVEEIVPTGSLDPDHIHLPGIYVHRIIQGQHEKRIEQRTTRPRPSGATRNQETA